MIYEMTIQVCYMKCSQRTQGGMMSPQEILQLGIVEIH